MLPGAILQQLPAQTIIELQHFVTEDVDSIEHSAVIALGRLTGLRKLSPNTNSDSAGAYNTWLPAVAAVSSMTHLTADSITSAGALQCLAST